MKSKHKSKSIFLFLFCLSMISPFFGADSSPQIQEGERIRENLTTLMLLRMTQVLNLTREQTAVIFPVMDRFEKEKMDLHQKMNKDIMNLRILLREKNPDEVKIAEKLENINELRSLIKEKEEDIKTFLEENLNLIQKARYILFSIDFYRGLGEKLEGARWMRNRTPQKRK